MGTSLWAKKVWLRKRPPVSASVPEGSSTTWSCPGATVTLRVVPPPVMVTLASKVKLGLLMVTPKGWSSWEGWVQTLPPALVSQKSKPEQSLSVVHGEPEKKQTLPPPSQVSPWAQSLSVEQEDQVLGESELSMSTAKYSQPRKLDVLLLSSQRLWQPSGVQSSLGSQAACSTQEPSTQRRGGWLVRQSKVPLVQPEFAGEQVPEPEQTSSGLLQGREEKVIWSGLQTFTRVPSQP